MMTIESLSEAQQRLGDAGFGDDLVAAGSRLRSVATGAEYDPATLKATEIVRFEGISDPDDEALLVAVSTRRGVPLGTFTTPYGPSASADQAEILHHLHRVVLSAEETSGHAAHDHVAAVFVDRVSAESAIKDLREVGLGSEHMGVAIDHSESAVFERDEEHDMMNDVGAGAGAGAVMGFLGGLLLFAMAVPGGGILAAGGIVLGVASGFGGAMLGGYAGVGAASEEFDEHQRLRETRLQPGEVLVVACGHSHERLVESALQRHGGRLLSEVSTDDRG